MHGKIFSVRNDTCTSTTEIVLIRVVKSYRPQAIAGNRFLFLFVLANMSGYRIRTMQLCRTVGIWRLSAIISGYGIWSRRQRAGGGILLEMPVEDIDFDLFSIRDQHRNRLSLHKTS